MTRATTSEAARLEAVEAVALPLAYTDEALEDVIALAVEAFDVPIAIVSLIERDQQVAIATHGAARVSAAREITFCMHAIATGETMVVADASADARFDANPFVRNAPHVRFYAGVLLRSEDGHVLGTLCIIDTKPRANFNAVEQIRLERLGRIAERRLQARALSKRFSTAKEAHVESEAYAQSVLQEAIGAFVACDRIALNLEGRIRAGVMRVQRELNQADSSAAAEAATLRDMIDELATAVRLDRQGAKQALYEPSAIVRAIVSDLTAEAAERKVYVDLQDVTGGCEMLGDSWRFEELIESVLVDCIATTQGPLGVGCCFETLLGGHEHLVIRITAEHSSSPWRFGSRNRELTEALAGCWEVSRDACAIALFLPARLRTHVAKAPQWRGNVISFDKARKGSQ